MAGKSWKASIDSDLFLYQHQPMQSGAISIVLLNIFAACLTSCSPTVTISNEDVSQTLKAAVELAAKSRKIPTNACIAANLQDSKTKIAGKVGEWTKSEGCRLSYRLLQAPGGGRLPPEAIAAIPEKMRASNCRHRLVFDKPEFLEMNEAGHTTTVAFVTFSDVCPVCGAGYKVMLTKSGGHWIADPPDIEGTWIS